MAYNKINWENGTIKKAGYVVIDGQQYETVEPEYEGSTPINADNLNHMDEGIKQLSDAQVKTEKFNFSLIPSSGSSIGTGSTTLDISSLNATEILGVTFNNGHNWLICGTNTDLTTNPSSLDIYGYRLNGTLTTAVLGSVVVMYR